ncbi:MAG: DNA polymerase III subunit chi [Acidiferrobacterales bacterium]
MTRIDFYVLQDADSGGIDLLVCRLVEKAFRRGHQTYVMTADPDHSARLDETLWTFSLGSFVPHSLYSPDGDKVGALPQPVLIGHHEPPASCQDVLVALGPHVPDCFSRFQRVADCVGASADEKRLARDRFRFYRDRGYPLENHPV